MIRVERTPAPTVLIGDNSPAAKENRRAAAFYADPTHDGKNFKFNVYRRREVKGALERLFHGKCAYCESKYLHNQPGDVEHFRPKGGYVVDEELQTPGYWWLAATWSNLLPSCIDCNRKRTQEFDDDVARGSGKENLFPILDEAQRARTPEEEARETRLLLDPCRDHPEKLLEFGEEGEIKARAGLEPLNQRKAETSIITYGLHRRRLNEARKEQILSILNQYDLVVERLDSFSQGPHDEELRSKLATSLKTFRRFRHASRNFTLMARQLVDPTLDMIRPFLNTTLGADLPPIADASSDILERFIAAYAKDENRRDRLARLTHLVGRDVASARPAP